jgi:hypothetical protein
MPHRAALPLPPPWTIEEHFGMPFLSPKRPVPALAPLSGPRPITPQAPMNEPRPMRSPVPISSPSHQLATTQIRLKIGVRARVVIVGFLARC